MLIDGHSLAFRAYFAFLRGSEGGLRTSTGIPTSVCYGFLKSMLDMMEAEKPDYAAVAFDLEQPTFRHQLDDSYKDGRPETPEEFLEDVHNLKELLQAFNLPVLTAPGYEADDVIGTLATQAQLAGYRVKILSGDQDLFQLIDPAGQVSVLHLGSVFAKGGRQSLAKEFKAAEVIEKLGIAPHQVVDYKALCGDASDNIPGVKGIGAKTAVKLLSEYSSLDEIYANLVNIKGAAQKRLEADREKAYHSQQMARIVLDVPLNANLADCKLEGFELNQVAPILKKLEFTHFLSRLPKLQVAFGGEALDVDQFASASVAAPVAAEDAFEDPDLAFFSAEETDQAQLQPIAAPKIKPQVIQTQDQLAELVARLQTLTATSSPVAWDTETTAIEPRDAELVGIGCCWGPSLADMAYIPTGHKQGEQLSVATVLTALRPILESDRHPKALQNAKFDRLVLRCQGIELKGVVFDTMLASYVINPESSHNLSELGLKYLNVVSESYSDLVPKGQSIADLDIARVARYCGTDVYTTFHLVAPLQQALATVPELATLFSHVEVLLEPVLAEMEYQGIRIDRDYLNNFSHQLETDLQAIEKKAYAAAGETFNLGSPKQLSELLFDKLGLDKRKSRKLKSGGYSTDAATLDKLQGDHAVVDLIVEHRTLAKLKSTYVDALPALVRPDTQRVHTDFNQAITATGRLSSSNPNLQNIPIRTAFSRQIRAAFIPAENWLLVAADYSQIELRILAHLSGEPVLVEAYRNQADVHTLTARLLFEKDEITAEERRLGKVINFGVIYGMGAARFARESGFSRSDAKVFIDRFNQRYPNVFAYLQQMQREAIAYGYVQTIMGRRRYFNFDSRTLKGLKGSDPNEVDLDQLKVRSYDAAYLRAAANAPIQGSSADIIKVAMIRLHELLKPYQARLLLQVHDELVFEIPPEEWADLQTRIADTMETAVGLKVPLKVEVHAGSNWMAAK
ncbi:DNA polymerase I [Almyronema epifaneia]|uniref:DNA polymerase I n=1 Tax=Almyronema epifaneia S1 TaxID=2991925 RepID=A0ABW6IJI3_9CYAN